MELAQRNSTATAEARQFAARFLAHRSRPRAGLLRAHRSGRLDRRSGQHLSLRHRAGRAALPGSMRRAGCAGLCRPGDVGKDRAESALERVQVHARGRDQRPTAPRTRGGRAGGGGYRASAFRRTSCRACSNGFIASRAPARAPTRDPVSAWRWCRNWSRCMAATIEVTSVLGQRARLFASVFRSATAHLPADRIKAAQR